jgi:hypothetical protein
MVRLFAVTVVISIPEPSIRLEMGMKSESGVVAPAIWLMAIMFLATGMLQKNPSLSSLL